jgi:hypothetical protein
MHPGPEISAYKPSLLTTPNVHFLPHTHIRSQSASRKPQSKVYIPTISRYLDALLAQHRWLEENERRALRLSGPAADVSYLYNTVSVFGDAKPKKEDIAITGKRAKEQDGGDFGSCRDIVLRRTPDPGGPSFPLSYIRSRYLVTVPYI